jgi:methionyl-tRNA formyltransferase
MDILFFGRQSCPLSKKCEALLMESGCNVTTCISKCRGESLPDEIKNWSGDYILSFRSYFILPSKLLKNVTRYAINFHPGPPEYPGTGCINFALYEKASTFGVTAHLMEPRVDTGKIIKVNRFNVLKKDSVSSLLKKTHEELFRLFEEILQNIVTQQLDISLKINSASSELWSSSATKIEDLLALQSVDVNVSEKQLLNIIRATFIENYPPFIILHGYKFNLESNKKTNLLKT